MPQMSPILLHIGSAIKTLKYQSPYGESILDYRSKPPHNQVTPTHSWSTTDWFQVPQSC